jgi:hypothetical protein
MIDGVACLTRSVAAVSAGLLLAIPTAAVPGPRPTAEAAVTIMVAAEAQPRPIPKPASTSKPTARTTEQRPPPVETPQSGAAAHHPARPRLVRRRPRGGKSVRVAAPLPPRGGSSSPIAVVPRARRSKPSVPVAGIRDPSILSDVRKAPGWLLGLVAGLITAEALLLGAFFVRRFKSPRSRRFSPRGR